MTIVKAPELKDQRNLKNKSKTTCHKKSGSKYDTKSCWTKSLTVKTKKNPIFYMETRAAQDD